MNKAELIAAVAEKAGISKKDSEKAINATFDTISAAMEAGESFDCTVEDHSSVGIKALDDGASKRADVNRDNDVNVTDISVIAAHIKGIKPID